MDFNADIKDTITNHTKVYYYLFSPHFYSDHYISWYLFCTFSERGDWGLQSLEWRVDVSKFWVSKRD